MGSAMYLLPEVVANAWVGNNRLITSSL